MHEWHWPNGAEFFEVAGWERPQWFKATRRSSSTTASHTRPNEWDARWWSPIINGEHLAMREHDGASSTWSAFALFDVVGPGALEAVQASRRSGRWTYPSGGSSTRRFCPRSVASRVDLTIMRLGDNVFRVVTGGALAACRDMKVASGDHLFAGGSRAIVDQTTAFTTIGLWGPSRP